MLLKVFVLNYLCKMLKFKSKFILKFEKLGRIVFIIGV